MFGNFDLTGVATGITSNMAGLGNVDNTSNGKWEYSAMIKLNTADITMFKTKKIRKIRLYIYDEEIEGNLSELYPSYIKCLTEMK